MEAENSFCLTEDRYLFQILRGKYLPIREICYVYLRASEEEN